MLNHNTHNTNNRQQVYITCKRQYYCADYKILIFRWKKILRLKNPSWKGSMKFDLLSIVVYIMYRLGVFV